jgi:hypothetical protein
VVDGHIDDDYDDSLEDYHLHRLLDHIDFDDHHHNYGYYEMCEHDIDHGHRVDCNPLEMVDLVMKHLDQILDQLIEH